MIGITRVVSGYLDSNMYILDLSGSRLVIDPCDNKEYPAEAELVFLTHEHFDHISGTQLYASHGAEVLAGRLCAQRLTSPVLNCSRHFNAFALLRGNPCHVTVQDYSCHADRIVDNGDAITVNGHNVLFLYTPGHLDSCFSLMTGNSIFTGDAVMLDENGNPAAPDRRFAELFRSITLPLLRSLPEETVVYPGHGNSFPLVDFLKRYTVE